MKEFVNAKTLGAIGSVFEPGEKPTVIFALDVLVKRLTLLSAWEDQEYFPKELFKRTVDLADASKETLTQLGDVVITGPESGLCIHALQTFADIEIGCPSRLYESMTRHFGVHPFQMLWHGFQARQMLHDFEITAV